MAASRETSQSQDWQVKAAIRTLGSLLALRVRHRARARNLAALPLTEDSRMPSGTELPFTLSVFKL